MTRRQEKLFVLEASSGGRLFSVNPDGSDKKVVVTGCRVPDGVAVDVMAGHIYWTNMGLPCGERRLDRTRGPGRRQPEDDRAQRCHVHAEATPLGGHAAGSCTGVIVRACA